MCCRIWVQAVDCSYLYLTLFWAELVRLTRIVLVAHFHWWDRSTTGCQNDTKDSEQTGRIVSLLWKDARVSMLKKKKKKPLPSPRSQSRFSLYEETWACIVPHSKFIISSICDATTKETTTRFTTASLPLFPLVHRSNAQRHCQQGWCNSHLSVLALQFVSVVSSLFVVSKPTTSQKQVMHAHYHLYSAVQNKLFYNQVFLVTVCWPLELTSNSSEVM